ncbi:hypothetical protein EVAR_87131_1 [Eumeta japonica]|uniref:Uncharacterized protein n=1 Tax=Eumeta variegata TaxID=151549 RepID=A0A4C1VVK1_EUMVA|nr:hypothetical protein EVAR_87131_1 [Eumeta japonica]
MAYINLPASRTRVCSGEERDQHRDRKSDEKQAWNQYRGVHKIQINRKVSYWRSAVRRATSRARGRRPLAQRAPAHARPVDAKYFDDSYDRIMHMKCSQPEIYVLPSHIKLNRITDGHSTPDLSTIK